MRSIVRLMIAALALLGLVGLLGAKVTPLAATAEETTEDEDEGPSFYAEATTRPIRLPSSAIQVQIELLRRRG